MNNRIMKNLMLIAVLGVSIMACKNTPKTEVTEEVPVKTVESFAEKVVANSVALRSVDDVADLLQLSGTRFMPELLNDPMNHDAYKNDPVIAAANIGVYLFDGTYQVAFGESYSGYLSISAAKQLAIELGIGDIMSEIVLERYAEGEQPADSILKLVKHGLSRSETMLTEKEQEQFFAAMLVGNYIEKLYVLFSNIYEYPVDLPAESKVIILRDVLIITSNELNLLPEAIAVVDKYKKSDTPYLLNELKAIEELRANYKLTEEEWLKLTPELIFENEGLLAIYDKVKAARAILVAAE